MKKFEVEERIEYIYQSAVRLAEGVLEDACARDWPDHAVAKAAMEWHVIRLMLEDSKRWRDKVRKADFDAVEST
ncbi:hypothetical protein PH547_11070 [Rhizobium sp. CNPSo 3464]|uniref:hypothetical protein n=1 Tax=Rhizobium sp. CNPSo 3464 TaxID=3021406 RepID=UPI00254F355E|nr:hypothetical protein [Rhizobium sp. CNPSo 3464]MDK4739414.1 hypothetical protein [Rhizobium sp. CNPSo 3464]